MNQTLMPTMASKVAFIDMEADDVDSTIRELSKLTPREALKEMGESYDMYEVWLD